MLGSFAGLSCPLVAVNYTTSFTGVNFTKVREDFIPNLKTMKVEAQGRKRANFLRT